MISGPLYTLAATVVNIACFVVLFQMYYLGVTERIIGGVAWSYFMFAAPAVLVIAVVNNQSAKNRSGSSAWRAVDGISSAALMVFVWITAILSTFVIGLPSSVPTPVLTSYMALVIIWTLAIWTLYDVFSNQKRNMHELLAKYPNARVVFEPRVGERGYSAAGAASAGGSVSLADAIDSGSSHVATATARRGELPVDFYIVPRIVMPNGDRIPLRRMPDMIDVTPSAASHDAAAQATPVQEGTTAPLN